MASRYERVFLLNNITNDSFAPVELMAAAIINDVITQDKSVQLKFQLKTAKPVREIVFSITLYDKNGIVLSRFPISFYGPFSAGMPLGTDVLTSTGRCDAATIDVALASVKLDGCIWQAGKGYIEDAKTITIIRQNQFFVVNPPFQVSVDNGASFDLHNGTQRDIRLDPGYHTIKFKLSFRETVVKVNITGGGSLTVISNRVTGKLDVTETNGLTYTYMVHK